MSKQFAIHRQNKVVNGTITLSGSKSISNRALIIQALCNDVFEISNLSPSDDTATMQCLLRQTEGVYDTGNAGTTFRFLTAYFAFRPGSQLLTGSQRMQQRPIANLVDALNAIGANIEYLNEQGYPPLMIHPPDNQRLNKVVIDAGTSSQFVSALLLIAPALPQGLEIHIEGNRVSKPYVDMTLNMMKYFGIQFEQAYNFIKVDHQSYHPRPFFVEADWSAASYFYSIAAIADEAKIVLQGLLPDSIQGDAQITNIAEKFGVDSSFDQNNNLQLSKSKNHNALSYFEYDFIDQPDIAQTVFTMCAGCNVSAVFTGLQTLHIKETDRLLAYKNELSKIGVLLNKVPPRFKKNDDRVYYSLHGDLIWPESVAFDTYDDHRMAMSLAPLALLHPIKINDVDVVSKSYPAFWEDLQTLGFIIE